MKNVGLVIQARSGSTRLPNKMLLPFYKELSLLEILLLRFKLYTKIPIIVATTTNRVDDRIVSICNNHHIEVFRGSENNVLSRFINISKLFSFDYMIRICADNPFFDIKGTINLLNQNINSADYISYILEGDIPSIKTHLGFWGEIVSTTALLRVEQETKEDSYYEHVTNYIYSHTNKFKCSFVKSPDLLYNRKDIRLTLDTLDDFKLYQHIYSEIVGDDTEIDMDKLIAFIDSNKNIKQKMATQIIINSK